MTDRSNDLADLSGLLPVEAELPVVAHDKEHASFRSNAFGMDVKVETPRSDYATARLERAKALAEGRVDEQPTLGGERTFYAHITKRE